MNNTAEQKPEAKTSRVQVDNLPQQEKQLNAQEAETIKGGGGLPGGVVPTSFAEESPQKRQS